MKTRVLVIESSGNLWGSERALLDLIDHVPSLELAVCCPPDRPLDAELDARGVRRLPYYVYALHQKPRWRRLQAAAGVLRACLEFRPDVIYLNQSGAYKVVLPAARLASAPIVAHVRIFEDAEYLARQDPDPRRLAGVIAISQAIESEIRRFDTLNDVALHTIYDAYSPAGRPVAQRPAKRRIACVGRLAPIKGQDVLVEALKVMKTPDIECLMAGSGEPGFEAELKAAAPKGVAWLGVVEDVAGVLETCSILAVPSRREPLGRVVFEAWDAGLVPVVFAGSGGAAEVVAEADGGVLYDEQAPASLAAALDAALALSASEAKRFVENGRAWMAANTDAARYGGAMSAILIEAARAA